MLQNDIALVTGASRGIGQAIAKALAGAGAKVIGTATTEAGAAGITSWLGGNGRGAVLDVGVAASIDALLGDLDTRAEMPTILVNNAAITRDTLLLRMKPEDWDAVIATNLSGTFRMARAALGAVSASARGRIVMVSSVAATMGNANQGAYAASKAGLLGLARSLARELAATGTTVNLVVPGPTEATGMTVDYNPAFVAAIARKIPLQRLGRPEETAHAVRMLLDDLASYITGTAVVVDGGLSM